MPWWGWLIAGGVVGAVGTMGYIFYVFKDMEI